LNAFHEPSAPRFRRPALALVGPAFLLLGLDACGAPPGPSGLPSELPVLQLSSEPTRQIGKIEGDSSYVFGDVVSARHLSSGNLLVADPMARQILEYSADGDFVRRIGRGGDGPGEFQTLSRIYVTADDSILTLDGINRRVSVFDSAGHFVHQLDAVDLSHDSVFAMDVWLYGRFWVDGAMDAGSRRRVREILDRLPQPIATPGYRYVQFDEEGRVWIREPGVTAGDSRMWTLFDADGRPSASLAIPVRFSPLEIRDHEMTGRWRGQSDVAVVRTYAFGETGQVRDTPSWLTAAPSPPAPLADRKEYLALVRTQIKYVASAEEVYYSTHFSYTAVIDSLSAFELDPSVYADIVQAGPRGWSAVFTHPGLDRICGLAYGYTIPPGWEPGALTCGPPARADSASTDPS